MSKWFVLEIVTADGATAKQVTEKSTLNEAYMLYHQVMGSVFANPAVTYALCQVINEEGFCQVSEKFPRADVEPEEI